MFCPLMVYIVDLFTSLLYFDPATSAALLQSHASMRTVHRSFPSLCLAQLQMGLLQGKGSGQSLCHEKKKKSPRKKKQGSLPDLPWKIRAQEHLRRSLNGPNPTGCPTAPRCRGLLRSFMSSVPLSQHIPLGENCSSEDFQIAPGPSVLSEYLLSFSIRKL